MFSVESENIGWKTTRFPCDVWSLRSFHCFKSRSCLPWVLSGRTSCCQQQPFGRSSVKRVKAAFTDMFSGVNYIFTLSVANIDFLTWLQFYTCILWRWNDYFDSMLPVSHHIFSISIFKSLHKADMFFCLITLWSPKLSIAWQGTCAAKRPASCEFLPLIILNLRCRPQTKTEIFNLFLFPDNTQKCWMIKFLYSCETNPHTPAKGCLPCKHTFFLRNKYKHKDIRNQSK